MSLMVKDYESGEEQSWYIDSDCSKHMAGDASKFIHISPKNSEHVIYGDNKQRPHFSPRKVNPKKSKYVIYGDNKQRPLIQQAQQVISNDTNRSLVFD